MPDMLREGLEQLVSAGHNIPLDWNADTLSTHSAEEVITMLVKRLRKNSKTQKPVHEEALPKTICFPYSRHSSLPELCHFIEAFQPKDVWPCTVNTAEWLRKGKPCGITALDVVNIYQELLFDLYSGDSVLARTLNMIESCKP
jgi:DNA cross-link repair 1C protein